MLPGRTRRACLAGALIALLSVPIPRAALARTLVVGGKGYTEQLLMAEMTRQLLTAKGFQIETRTGFDTNALRQAQEAGQIDLYWEYTGTSLREFNKITEKLTPVETYNRVKELDAPATSRECVTEPDPRSAWNRPSAATAPLRGSPQ